MITAASVRKALKEGRELHASIRSLGKDATFRPGMYPPDGIFREGCKVQVLSTTQRVDMVLGKVTVPDCLCARPGSDDFRPVRDCNALLRIAKMSAV